MSEDIIKRMLSRKFILAVLLALISTALIGFGKIDGEQWANMAMVLYICFTIGNTVENFRGN